MAVRVALLLLAVYIIVIILLSMYFSSSSKNDTRYSCADKELLNVKDFKRCYLKQYRVEDVVSCLDSLFIDSNNSKLNFAFVGDSRIRQQFLNFLKLVPDYDRMPNAALTQHLVHQDADITSSVLNNLVVSFRWRPFIDDRFLQEFQDWTTSNIWEPHFILIGMGSHHMLSEHGNDERLFERRLAQLRSSISLFQFRDSLVWLNQYPTVDFYADNGQNKANIHAEKIQQYNNIARRVLEGIRIWDSGNPVVEDYVRGCYFFRRGDRFNLFGQAYNNCSDFIHSGYSALSQTTQLLFNTLCSSSEM